MRACSAATVAALIIDAVAIVMPIRDHATIAAMFGNAPFGTSVLILLPCKSAGLCVEQPVLPDLN
ncbi:hypothetical protein [Methylocaldum gracile]|uniref:hypothetical protein n=1 Tax=unclassified Methylocaldum TaxID=2622260 RepID=UPI00105B7116